MPNGVDALPAAQEAVKKPKKKAVKKAVAPKGAGEKKPTKKQSAAALHRNAGPGEVFVMVNGQRLKNVKELADVLEKIEDYVFNHHVTEDRNDFASWLQDVFKEIDLAKEVSGCRDKNHLQLVLYRHISHKLW